MSWMNLAEYVLIEQATDDRLTELRHTAEWRPFLLAPPARRARLQLCPMRAWSDAGARRFSHALVSALGALAVLAVAATALV